ncbi:MAG: superoxide dismutase [Patescibacteria group bacterium]|jgi:Fe-Mn family superoxide dismutase
MLDFFKLPYNPSSFNGFISAETFSYHYDKHHKTYFDNLIKLISGTELEGKSLVEIIKASYNNPQLKSIYNNSAQVFNHDFYWQSLSPDKLEISNFLKEKIIESFSSLDEFKLNLKSTGLSQFGSGWVWVILEDDKIKITSLPNADSPLINNQKPLLCIDVWEHAYYIDYRNNRAEYLEMLINNSINWNFFEENLKENI